MKIFMRLFKVSLFFLIFIFGCEDAIQQVEVTHVGALREIMHENRLESRLDLSVLKGEKNLYGLGALENLKGEILIWDGNSILSSEDRSAIRVKESFEAKAALLVYTKVSEWITIEIPKTVQSQEDFAKFLEDKLQKENLDTNRPMPFLLKGKAKKIKWHVINWPENDHKHTHRKHKLAGLNGTLLNVSVNILGFFSKAHKGVFTHHSSDMHMHVQTQNGDISAHLDELEFSEGMELFLPKE